MPFIAVYFSRKMVHKITFTHLTVKTVFCKSFGVPWLSWRKCRLLVKCAKEAVTSVAVN